jgi:hypothetical protein
MLDHRLFRTARALLLALVALGSLQAQETGFYKDVKIRTGYGLATKDNLRASSLGFGLNLGYATGQAKWAVELGYSYKTGDQYMVDPAGTLPKGLTALDTARFGDSRRNSLDGFAVRASYTRSINEDWDWQAGLMLGGTRFKHEYVGQAQSTGWASGSDDNGSWLDTWNGTPSKGGFSVSPYVGVTWKMGPVSSLEFNVVLLSYSALEYVHHVGTGVYDFPANADSAVGRISPNNGFPGDELNTTKRMVPHIEVGYVFHF